MNCNSLSCLQWIFPQPTIGLNASGQVKVVFNLCSLQHREDFEVGYPVRSCKNAPISPQCLGWKCLIIWITLRTCSFYCTAANILHTIWPNLLPNRCLQCFDRSCVAFTSWRLMKMQDSILCWDLSLRWCPLLWSVASLALSACWMEWCPTSPDSPSFEQETNLTGAKVMAPTVQN